MQMNDKVEQTRLGPYAIDVFYDDAVTYFSIVERSQPGRSRMLMWKRNVGFRTNVVVSDPLSDLEVAKPLEPSEFPDEELLRLLREHPDALSRNLVAQLIAILAGREKSQKGSWVDS